MTPAAFAIIFVMSGFSNALQARSNGELTRHLGNGVQAAFFSFTSGLLMLSVALAFSASMRAGVRRILPAVRAGDLAWWAVPTGILGGLFIACQSYSAAAIGVALFSIGMVTGQTANSIFVDRIGLSPVGRTPITLRRVVSAVISVVAVFIAVSNRLGGVDLSVMALVAAFSGGVIVAFQQALNGRVNVASRQPVSTTWVNFVFGSASLGVGVLIGVIFFDAQVAMPSTGPWWMFLGGFFGLVFIVTASWSVPRFGVFIFAIVTIAGQLTAALLLDIAAPVGENRIAWNLVLGVALTFMAVGLGGFSRGFWRGARSDRGKPASTLPL